MNIAPKLKGGPLVMGVLNVTPDSFSDGGRFRGQDAVKQALTMLEDGADLIDIGGESTRPGAEPVSLDEEIARVVPVIEALAHETDAPISIDTMKPLAAQAAFSAGATIWNDVAALREEGALAMAGKLKAPVILMHMQGEPRTMQAHPHYGDVVAEVSAFLRARVEAARDAGALPIFVDAGLGFGKTPAHNLALLRASAEIERATGLPVLVGASRKSMIERLEGRKSDAQTGRIGGSLALALEAARAGAAMLRVHDVRETVQALSVWKAIQA